MRLFITGSSSFIGRELLALCDRRGMEVIGVDMSSPTRSDCHMADIRSPDICDLIPRDADAVVHLAALSRDPDCQNRAMPCFDINVMGTLNLMEAAQDRGVKQFIFASSEWVYDSFEPSIEKREDDPINPANLQSEYALSKLVSEANLRQKYRHGFCPVTILRFGIIYGPRKDNWSAVEYLLNGVATREEIAVGALATGRRFIHVQDITTSILASIGLPGFEILNIQGERMVSLGDIIQESQSLLDRNTRIVENTPGSASIRLINGDKARHLLQWKPEIGLRAGLDSVAAFLGLKSK